MTTDELALLTKARDKLKTDLDWRGPRGRATSLIVLDREQAAAVLTVVERVLAEESPP